MFNNNINDVYKSSLSDDISYQMVNSIEHAISTCLIDRRKCSLLRGFASKIRVSWIQGETRSSSGGVGNADI